MDMLPRIIRYLWCGIWLGTHKRIHAILERKGNGKINIIARILRLELGSQIEIPPRRKQKERHGSVLMWTTQPCKDTAFTFPWGISISLPFQDPVA